MKIKVSEQSLYKTAFDLLFSPHNKCSPEFNLEGKYPCLGWLLMKRVLKLMYWIQEITEMETYLMDLYLKKELESYQYRLE